MALMSGTMDSSNWREGKSSTSSSSSSDAAGVVHSQVRRIKEEDEKIWAAENKAPLLLPPPPKPQWPAPEARAGSGLQLQGLSRRALTASPLGRVGRPISVGN